MPPRSSTLAEQPLVDEVTIAARFNGPPTSANGGYACGVLAAAIGPSARVRLSQPPPLEVPMTRGREEDGAVRLLHGDVTVAEAHPARPAVDVPETPTLAVATRAAQSFAGRCPEHHPFPTCFVCGPQRAADGLGIFPGPAGKDGLLAAPWIPKADLAADGVVDPLFVWAALDCPSGFACAPSGTQTVLASMAAALEEPLYPDRAYIVTAWPIASEGRKHRAGSAIHEQGGRRVAVAEALWITIRNDSAAELAGSAEDSAAERKMTTLSEGAPVAAH